MIRWIFVCLLLSVGAVAAVWAVAPKGEAEPVKPEAQAANRKNQEPEQPAQAVVPHLPMTTGLRPLPELLVYGRVDDQAIVEPILIPGARLVIFEAQDLPSEKEGKLLFIGTRVQMGEVVPLDKQLPDAELGFLATPVGRDEKLPDGEMPFQPGGVGPWYRRVQETDTFEPDKIILFREFVPVRKLQVGDKVKRGQLLGLVNPKKSFDEVAIRVTKLNGAAAERLASQKQKEEYQKRLVIFERLERTNPGAVSQEEKRTAQVQRDKFLYEEKKKITEISQAQRELNASLTDLRMHEIRAAIDGTVMVINKNSEGDAVKPYETVLRIENSARLRVEGLLDVQEAHKLREGMNVLVEASRPESPHLVISGHLDTVNCVAVSKSKRPIVVSGSKDETLRGWDSVTGAKLWLMAGLKSSVLSVACTPPGSKHNLAVFGCADGNVRLLDLDKIHKGEKPRDLAERHQGAVNGVAFSPDGEVCATCGDDRNIFLWKTATGELLYRLQQAHRGPVTSVHFASSKRLVSAGRDNRLVVWDVEAGKPPRKLLRPEFDGRGGEVADIGASPDGQVVLFDQGKELRLLSLADKQIVGTLQNPSEAMNFSTMALFSPDGKTILTNGSAPGKLQLWRTPQAQARASELRQFIWKGTVTCGAFAPGDGSFAVTGTQDKQVLVWRMPEKNEVESRLDARLVLVEKHLDTQSLQVRVWAELQNPGWLIPGIRATMVIPPQK